MSFREKSAWVTFVLLLAMFFVYFGNVFAVYHTHAQAPVPLFHLFVALFLGFVIIEIVAHIILAIRAPRDAETPRDERERLIETKAARTAYYILLSGGFLMIGMAHLTRSALGMAHGIFFVIWIAELTRYGTQLYHYRRGA